MDADPAAPSGLEPTVDLVAAEGEADRILRFDAEVRNALSVLTGTSRLLEQRWDELPPERRRALVEAIARRADELQSMLLPVLSRLTHERTTRSSR